MTEPKVRRAITRWPFSCRACRRYVLRGEWRLNHGDGWLCAKCSTDRSISNREQQQETRP